MEKSINAYFKFPFSPEEAVKEVFESIDSDGLIVELNKWWPVALANKIGDYTEPEDRESLLVFIDDYKELLEVMSAPYFLNKKDYTLVTEEFKNKYSIDYVRQELFNLFVSVATYEGRIDFDKLNIGIYYLYYTTLSDAAFLLNSTN